MVLCYKARTSRRREDLLMDIIKMLEDEQLRNDMPAFNVGDTVQVHEFKLLFPVFKVLMKPYFSAVVPF